MVAEEYYLDRGHFVKTKYNPIELIAVGVLIIAVIAAVALSLVVLIKVNDSSSNSPATTTASTTTQQCTKRIHQDVVVMYDASIITGDLSLFKATNDYLSTTFFADWAIGTATQVAIIPFPNSDAFHDQSGFGDFGTARGANDLQYLLRRQAQLLTNGSVQTSSSSDIIDGLNATNKYLVGQLHDRPEARNTAIIFATSSTGSTEVSQDVAYHMKRNGMFFLTVAVGPAINCTSLFDIVSNGAYAFNITDPSDLSAGTLLAKNIHDLLLTIPNGSICL